MATITTQYIGNLRSLNTHTGSGAELITDAPKDNKGMGASFSPTDLLATSLGTCMLTIMGIAAREHEMNIENTRMEITKIMAADPRRVAEIQVVFHLPSALNGKERTILERSAHTCPVALSLHPDLKKTINFLYKL